MNQPAIANDSGRPVLVTGAAGFIGSHLCEALLARGRQVIGVDCFTDYYARGVKENNLRNALGQPGFRLVEADLVEADLARLLDGVEVIYHLAGQPGVRGSWGRQFEVYTRNNILATQRLLEASRAANDIPLVYASSSSAYGNRPEMPLRESAAPAPISPYGVTKLAAENLCRLYNDVYGLPTLSLRLFTVYGPRQRPDMGFQRFLRAAAAGKEIELYGDGTQTRDFTYVADVVRAFLLAGEACLARRTDVQVINIAGGTRASVNEVLAAIASLAGGELRLRRLPAQPGDVRDTWADTRLAASALGFRPEIDLPAGLDISYLLAPFLIALFFVSFFYFFFVPVKLKWFQLLTGSLITVFLWSLLRPAFSLILQLNPDYGFAFGSLKAVFLLVIWVYYFFTVMLAGAEVMANMKRKEALRFRGLFYNQKSGRKIPNKFVKVFDKGEVVFKEGEIGQEMFFILSGSAVVHKEEKILRVISEGDYFGEIAMLLNVPRTATVTVLEADTRMVCISYDNFETLLRENSDIVLTLLKEMSARLKESDKEVFPAVL